MEDTDELVESILIGIGAFPEHKMRLEFLSKRLSGLDPDRTALVLDGLLKKDPRHPPASRARAMLVDPVGVKEALGDERCRKVYLASLGLGLRRISRLFTDLPPHKKGVAGYDHEEEVRMEHLTLGERRALSKTNLKDNLDRLLSDPDPVVIGNILDNPRITEREVLKIASKRPGSPEILRLVGAHRVWSRRYAVQKAVVLNPYSPPRIAIALLEFLRTPDLAAVAVDATLHPQVRMAAGEIVEERGEG